MRRLLNSCLLRVTTTTNSAGSVLSSHCVPLCLAYNPTVPQDSENNTILMLLADQKPTAPSSYSTTSEDNTGAHLRMARLYYDRYTWILDWSNVHGKTALHIAALKGNEELVRVWPHFVAAPSMFLIIIPFNQMLCDLGADFDLSDNKGNTPLH